MDIAAEALQKHTDWKGKIAFDPKMDIDTRHDLAVAHIRPGWPSPAR